MATNANPEIKVSANAGLIDTLTAAGRMAVVIIGSIPILLQFLGDRNLIGLVNYFRTEDGTALTTAAVALFMLGWGLWKTHRRGGQIATVAANPRVPDSVAALK